jgi:hypothetical protein
MGSFFDPRDRDAMLARLRRLRPEAPRRWGKMSAPQMVAHLIDQLHHALGDTSCRPVPGRLLRWAPVRWAAIYVVPWPRGLLKGPADAFVTRPTEWSADVAALEALVHRLAARADQKSWPEHAMLGRMTGRDWAAISHKHFDHHLRQFGT